MELVNISNVQRIDNFHQPFSTLFDTKTIYINLNFNENHLLILKYILILHIKIVSNTSNVQRIDNSKSTIFYHFRYIKIYININFNKNRLLILKYILVLHSKSCFYFNFYYKVHIFISHFLE
jgi:hypothetical protein